MWIVPTTVVGSMLAFGGVAFGGTTATSDQTIVVVATHVHFTTADVGDAGASPGDELVFTARDVNLDGDVVGRLDGYCVFTKIANGEDQYEECFLTHTLDDGQITLQGQFLQGSDEVQRFAVTGGTDAYAGAEGDVLLKFAHRFRFDIDLQD